MKRFKIIFEYEGTNFSGYQRQDDERTVQDEIEKVLKKISGGVNVLITSSGRTDKGVHALNQVASFNLPITIGITKLKRALNTYLPNDIYVHTVEEIDDKFHPRFHAIKKEYKYILNEYEYDTFKRNLVYQYGKKLNIIEMRKASKFLIGTHNFRSFTTGSRSKDNFTRTIFDIKINRVNDNIEFLFVGSGFLKYQVRNMVGALIKVGEKNLSYKDIRRILKQKDRTKAPKAAPGEGLYLVKVHYD